MVIQLKTGRGGPSGVLSVLEPPSVPGKLLLAGPWWEPEVVCSKAIMVLALCYPGYAARAWKEWDHT